MRSFLRTLRQYEPHILLVTIGTAASIFFFTRPEPEKTGVITRSMAEKVNTLVQLQTKNIIEKTISIFSSNKKATIPQPAQPVVNLPQFSRTTFFFDQPYIGSIALPESWQGKYKTSELPGSIDFIYALPGELGYPIFNISEYDLQDWQKLKNENDSQEVLRVENQIFVFKTYNSPPVDKIRSEVYWLMQNEAKAAVETIKSHKKP